MADRHRDHHGKEDAKKILNNFEKIDCDLFFFFFNLIKMLIIAITIIIKTTGTNNTHQLYNYLGLIKK